MSSLKTPETSKSRRIPNAFMLFVKEQKKDLLQNCPEENKSMIGAFIGKKWRSMTIEEKKVYFDKYKALKKEMKDNKTDSNLEVHEKLMENEDANKFITNEFSGNICSSDLDVTDDYELNKLTTEENDGILKKNKTDYSSVSNIGGSSISHFPKQSSLKKVRRPPNAFVLFANERRYTLDPSIKKDKKLHVNAILGNMWKELPDAEKSKYYDESRRLLSIYKKNEIISSSKILKKAKNVQLKNIPKVSVGRPCKKKKDFLPETSTRLRSHEAKDIEKSKIELNSSKSADNVQNTGSTSSREPPHVSNEYPNSSCPIQHSIAQSHFHPLMPSTESHHSKPHLFQSAVSSNCSNNDNLKLPSANDPGIPRSCFGTGMFPPLFPSYPFNTPFWMHQQAMSHHMFPFPSPGLLQSPCCCNMPYSYYSTYNNAYFNSYSSLYSGKCAGSFSYASHSSNSAANVGNKEESAEATKNAENSEDEVLIVDEGGHHNRGQNQENETA